jgi:hypothetical protein
MGIGEALNEAPVGLTLVRPVPEGRGPPVPRTVVVRVSVMIEVSVRVLVKSWLADIVTSVVVRVVVDRERVEFAKGPTAVDDEPAKPFPVFPAVPVARPLVPLRVAVCVRVPVVVELRVRVRREVEDAPEPPLPEEVEPAATLLPDVTVCELLGSCTGRT